MDRNDSDDPAACPWCDALREASLPPTALPTVPSERRRHDPYVSGAQYDGDYVSGAHYGDEAW
ncbi:hypothetical protein [Streptomyces sp. NPDC098781]|uniref:hypothetical protein n=1 Tax=Streptomyces sp. NPDC098781 TaxID=3366097 RepID=UPI0038107194